MATTIGNLIRQAREHLAEVYALVTPGSPLVSPQGTTGATTYSYKVVARNADGTSEASQIGTTTTGNAALSVTNFNRLTWTEVPYAVSYDIYRTVGGATTGKVVSATTALTADDTGLVGDATSAPTVNTSGVVRGYWNDAELRDIAVRGLTDLWSAVMDLNQEYFNTIDETNMSIAASGTQITGVPSDLFRIGLIEPRDTTQSGSGRNVLFVPRDYNHRDFTVARSLSPQDPSGDMIIYYTVTGAGSPIAAPVILVAPKLTSALTLRVMYVPTLGASSLLTTSNNPIPGESDNAVVAWIVAFARAKEREDRMPDQGWLSIYSTEKASLLTRMTPRQTQEPDVVEGLFEDYWMNQ